MFIEPASIPPVYDLDEDLCFKLKPSLNITHNTKEFQTKFITNNIGFRGDMSKFKNNSIMFLGDSFTFGSGVEQNETYVQLVENNLRLNGYDYFTYNFGVGNYGTINEQKVLERYIDFVKPKLVVLGFYVNDARDNKQKCSFDIDEKGYLTTKKAPKSFLYNFKKEVHLNFNLYRILNKFIKDIKLKTRLFDSFASNMKLNVPIDYKQFEKEYDDETSSAWIITYTTLEEISNLSKKSDADLIVVVIPSKSQLEKAKQERLSNIYNLKNPDFHKINKNLLNFTKSKNIHFIDLTETFLNKEGTKNNYFVIDPHWTKKGHKIAADAISKYLTDNRLVLKNE